MFAYITLKAKQPITRDLAVLSRKYDWVRFAMESLGDVPVGAAYGLQGFFGLYLAGQLDDGPEDMVK